MENIFVRLFLICLRERSIKSEEARISVIVCATNKFDQNVEGESEEKNRV